MRKQAHTPAPWRVEQPNVETPNIWIVADGNAGIAKIERCDYDDGSGHRHTDEDYANALLISLAPELAEALRELMDFDSEAYDRKSSRAIALLVAKKKASALLSKLKGSK